MWVLVIKLYVDILYSTSAYDSEYGFRKCEYSNIIGNTVVSRTYCEHPLLGAANLLCEATWSFPKKWHLYTNKPHMCSCCADKWHNPTKCHSPRQMSQQPSTNVTANDKCQNIASTNVTALDKCHSFASTNVTANDKCHNFASTNVTANDKCHNITMITNDKCHNLPTKVSRQITWTGWTTLSLVRCRIVYSIRDP